MKLPERPRAPRTGPDYARALRTLRAYRNLAQRDLAARSGFSYGTVSKWERNGRIAVPYRQIMAEALAVPFDVFEALARTKDPIVQAMAGSGRWVEPNRWWNYQQAARAVGCCPNTVRRAVNEGIVTPRRENRNTTLFDANDLKKIGDWYRGRRVLFVSRLRSHTTTKLRREAA